MTDRTAREGIALLLSQLPGVQIDVQLRLMPEQLQMLIGSYSALIVCSETQVTDELLAAATRLQVVRWAGSGLDNIDLEPTTRREVMVVNAPKSIVIAAAEHTIALLLELARHIPSANSSIKAGRWEKCRLMPSRKLCNEGKETSRLSTNVAVMSRRLRLKDAFRFSHKHIKDTGNKSLI